MAAAGEWWVVQQGVPTAANFAALRGQGSPGIVDSLTGTAYYLAPGDVVTPLAASMTTVVWRDLVGTIINQDVGSANAFAWTAWKGGIKQYAQPLAGASMREQVFTYHIDHDYKPISDIYIHAHWSQIVADAGKAVKWYFEVTYAKGHQQESFITPITTSVTQSCDGTKHMIAEVQLSATAPSASQLDSDNLEVDGLIIVRCYRDTADVADTATQVVYLHTVDCHYLSDRPGTLNKAPNFYA